MSLNILVHTMIMMRLMKRGHIQSSETNPCLVFGLSGHVSSIRNSRITFALHLYHVVSGHMQSIRNSHITFALHLYHVVSGHVQSIRNKLITFSLLVVLCCIRLHVKHKKWTLYIRITSDSCCKRPLVKHKKQTCYLQHTSCTTFVVCCIIMQKQRTP